MDEDEEGDEQLQIDLSCDSRAELKPTGSGAAERHSAMTWLQAAEHVLREEGGLGMHIRELTRTILELGMVRGRLVCKFLSGNSLHVSIRGCSPQHQHNL